jgi:hypothetical protein
VNLVNELQVSTERDDVLTVLRKAMRLASKLGVDDIGQWLESEQTGYSKDVSLPSYREVTAGLVCDTNGPVPNGYGFMVQGMIPVPNHQVIPYPIRLSISRLQAMIANATTLKKECVHFGIPNELELRIRPSLVMVLKDRGTLWHEVHLSSLMAISESVKDTILHWALELERRGVLGDGVTFNENEKAIAHTIIFNLTNCKVEQLNNMGQNVLTRTDSSENSQ